MPEQNKPRPRRSESDRPSGRDGGSNKQNDSPRGDGKRNNPPNMMGRGMWGWALLAMLLVALLLMLTTVQQRHKEVPITDFIQYAAAKDFQGTIIVEDDRMRGTLKDETTAIPIDPSWQKPYRIEAAISPDTKADWIKELRAVGWNDIQEKPGGSILLPIFLTWGPFIVIALLIYFFVFRSIRNAGGGPGMLGSFGRSRHRVTTKEHSNVTLDDVAGIDEAREEVSEIIEFLKNPKKFQRLGGRVPRGVLLIGEPGCGKTLLAKAVAGEADVPFFSISGSDFVEMFVGVGASRVRDLFKQAKENAPCIIFLDEIDAVGRRRGSGFSSGGHDEREQTLNAILVEMDGFDSSDQVIVIAATNRADVLDPALTRPGRFDRQIHVPLPDIQGRIEILKVHSRRIKMSPSVDLVRLARGTPMFSGADLAAIINEAAIAATLAGKDFVEQEDLEEARDKVKWGRARKSHRIEEDEKRVIAYHEAGHAVVTYFDPDAEPLHKVTIIPRGQALGVTFMLPEKDRHIWKRKQLLAQLRVTFGGRIAEEMFCGDISSGAAQDIRQASNIARAMVTQYGMSEKLGFLLYGMDESRNPWEQPEKLYSDETARMIDEEVKALIDRTYNETRQLLTERREEVERLAQALLRYETLSREEVDKIMQGKPLHKQTVTDILKTEKEKTIAPTRAEDDGLAPGGVLPSPA
mgnify:CR=1 FL=1